MLKSLGMNTMQKVKRTSLEYTLRAGFKNSAALHNRIFAKLVTDDLQEVMDALSAQTRQHRTHQKSILPHVQVCYGKQFMYKRLFILCRNHTG